MDPQIQKRLQSLDKQIFLELLHACVNELCGRKAQTFDNFGASLNWKIEDYKLVCSKLKELLILAVAKHLPDEQIVQQVAELDVAHQQCILDCVEVRKNDIVSVLQQISCGISGPALKDFDWKVKWIMGSSKLSSLREPLLSLDLHVEEGKGQEGRTISLELNKTELATLLSALEKAQETMRQS